MNLWKRIDYKPSESTDGQAVVTFRQLDPEMSREAAYRALSRPLGWAATSGVSRIGHVYAAADAVLAALEELDAS